MLASDIRVDLVISILESAGIQDRAAITWFDVDCFILESVDMCDFFDNEILALSQRTWPGSNGFEGRLIYRIVCNLQVESRVAEQIQVVDYITNA